MVPHTLGGEAVRTTCARCGKPLPPHCHANRLYCGSACERAARRGRERERWHRRKGKPPGKPKGRRGHTLPESVSAKMTDAELDALIAIQRPTMPADKGEDDASPEPVTIRVIRCSKRWNGWHYGG